MSNEDLPQSAELASAYLDGELDGPQRAAANSDPDVVAAIDSFTRVRTQLGEGVPVDPATRDSAITAALAVFDAMHATSSPEEVPAAAAAAPVVSLQSRRHRAYRIVSGAAAAAIVGVVAIAALNSADSSNDRQDAATFATEAPVIAEADAPDLKSVAADAAGATEEAAPPEATTADASASGAGADSAAAEIPNIDTAAALTQYAAGIEVAATTALTAAPADTAAAETLPPTAPSPQDAPRGYAAIACLSSDQFVLGAIVYQGTPALAVRNTATGALQAIADTDCRLLVAVTSP